jgi:CheY-like chemotaxis protein
MRQTSPSITRAPLYSTQARARSATCKATSALPACRPALELLDAGNFNLGLLNSLMLELDGFAVLACLNRDPARRDLLVFVISTLDEKCILFPGYRNNHYLTIR